MKASFITGIAVTAGAFASVDCTGWRHCGTVAGIDFEIPEIAPYPGKITNRSGRLVLVGDLQRTSYFECRLLGRRVNDGLTRSLLAEIAALEPEPDAVVILGDLVFDAGSTRHWGWFDHLMAPIRERGLPVLPLRGNHEYWPWFFQGSAEKGITARFPWLRDKLWESRRYGPLGLIWLDSNWDQIERGQWTEQLTWFETELEAFDSDRAVRGVLVFTHHPPYSNSPFTGGGDQHVLDDLVPLFKASRKGLAMVSGHAHGYERFIENGRPYIVSGGGGGPRPDFLLDEPPRDRFAGPSCSGDGTAPPRPFNYLIVTTDQAAIHIEAWGKCTQDGGTSRIDAIALPFP